MALSPLTARRREGSLRRKIGVILRKPYSRKWAVLTGRLFSEHENPLKRRYSIPLQAVYLYLDRACTVHATRGSRRRILQRAAWNVNHRETSATRGLNRQPSRTKWPT